MSIREPLDRLTPRELQVLARLPKNNKQIAQALGMSEGTVEQHLNHIYSKLGISRDGNSPRTAAILYALQYGLLSLDDVEDL